MVLLRLLTDKGGGGVGDKNTPAFPKSVTHIIQ